MTEVAYSRHNEAPDWFDKTGKIYPARATEILTAKDKNAAYLLGDHELKLFGDPAKLLQRDGLDTVAYTAKGTPRKRQQPLVKQGRKGTGKMDTKSNCSEELSLAGKTALAGAFLALERDDVTVTGWKRSTQARKDAAEHESKLALLQVDYDGRCAFMVNESSKLTGDSPKFRETAAQKLARSPRHRAHPIL
ncbi:unnamed protein product [Zymoseptoria tritici ST99CH_1E4]|uniref:Uncharacterized protein n=1 Tax=Zymoseptoria tritici ST99CH_1E4 TaxID=1276532 RepID=A0A2H1HBY8_ZYMTR|nr:unnamed protein product [Zymoseptoria tritici ST99CH_1E4]